jgi:hypothetical protein
MTLPLLDHNQPKQPYGYRCRLCSAVWDAVHPPFGDRSAIEVFLQEWKKARCPSCRADGPSMVKPSRYAELRRGAA